MNDKQLIIIEGHAQPKTIDLDKIHRVIAWAAEGLEIDNSVDAALASMTSGSILVYRRNNVFTLLKHQEALWSTHNQASLIALLYRASSAVRDRGNEVITKLLLSCGRITRAPPQEDKLH